MRISLEPTKSDRPLTVRTYLDFEKPIAELESKVSELKALEGDEGVSISDEIKKLEQKAKAALVDTYGKLTPWQKTQVARHPDRPHCLDYVKALIEDFTPLAGDRYFAEDEAVMGGLGRFRGKPVVVIGHEKGSDTEGRIRHNFGMARPEGYRKAVRLMDLADKFNLPVITLVDTAGAYPGIGAEERGQAEAIARSTDKCLEIGVPIIAVVIGEGGSGGAVAIATANRILMLEHSIYTVASPEAAASILWRDSAKAIDAATNMKITAQDLDTLGVIDVIIREPVGGAHRDRALAIQTAGDAIAKALAEFEGKTPAEIRALRHERFLGIGRQL
jgi:acetyl-CoA carboxylase carboxyl transferase subunit alpha